MIPPILQHRYSAGLAVSPVQLSFGFDSTDRYKSANKRNAGVNKAAGRFIRTGVDYFNSYSKEESPTLGHYRDYLVSRAIAIMATNFQYPDATATAITPHARRAWLTYAFEQLWPHIPVKARDYNPTFRYAGGLGTLAYFFQFVETEGLYPMQAMDACLNQVWTLLGGGYGSGNVRARHINFLNRFVPPQTTLNTIETALSLLYSIPRSHDQYYLRQLLRRDLVGSNDVLRLKQRILMGEYIDRVIDVAEELITLAQTENDVAIEFGLSGVEPGVLRKFTNSTLSILKPTGMPLVYAAFAAEGFLKAAMHITDMDDAQLSTPVVTYLDQVGEDINNKIAIANHLATVVDAATILGEFETINTADFLADEIQAKSLSWLMSAGATRIEPTAPSRLEGFFNAIT